MAVNQLLYQLDFYVVVYAVNMDADLKINYKFQLSKIPPAFKMSFSKVILYSVWKQLQMISKVLIKLFLLGGSRTVFSLTFQWLEQLYSMWKQTRKPRGRGSSSISYILSRQQSPLNALCTGS